MLVGFFVAPLFFWTTEVGLLMEKFCLEICQDYDPQFQFTMELIILFRLVVYFILIDLKLINSVFLVYSGFVCIYFILVSINLL